MHDAVRVDVERHFDLRHPTRSWRNSYQIELAEELVIVRHLTFALKDTDCHSCLIVGCCGEDLALFSRDSRVALDQFREDAAEGFDTQ